MSLMRWVLRRSRAHRARRTSALLGVDPSSATSGTTDKLLLVSARRFWTRRVAEREAADRNLRRRVTSYGPTYEWRVIPISGLRRYGLASFQNYAERTS